MSQSINSNVSEMFYAFCHVLEKNKINYVLLGNIDGYPEAIDSDVDFMVSETDFKKLDTFLSAEKALGSNTKLLQVLRHEISATYYVFGIQRGKELTCIALDACHDYRKNGRLWLSSEHVLRNRVKNIEGLWAPCVKDNFTYYLIKRVLKRSFDVEHLHYFKQLFEANSKECDQVLNKLFSQERALAVKKALQAEDLNWFQNNIVTLSVDLHKHYRIENRWKSSISHLKELQRKWHRVCRPTGLVMAVLGPDGSGKSTIIDFAVNSVRDAFRGSQYYHLRPHFGKVNTGVSIENPHAQAPRPFFFGALKLILFTLDYWFGWLWFIWPKKVSSTLIVFDRYYHDMLVDSYRYRLPNNFKLTSVFERFIPKPDIWLILTAPAQVLVDRKGEVPLEVAQEQVHKYEILQKKLKNACLINTDTELEQTCEQVLSVLLLTIEQNARRQIKA